MILFRRCRKDENKRVNGWERGVGSSVSQYKSMEGGGNEIKERRNL